MIKILRSARRAWRFVANAIRPGVEVASVTDDVEADWNAPVTLRDGTVLRANVFRPHGPGPFPVIMSAHPYGKDKIPAKTRTGRGPPLQSRFLPQPRPVRISAYTSWEAPDPAVWVAAGYAVVNADLRGGGTSEGIADLFSDESSYGFSGDMVSKGWLRLAHRECDSALSTPAQPVHTNRRAEPLRPEERVRVAIEMRPHATRLRAGDQLRLDLQGRWFYPHSALFGQFPAAYQASPADLCTLRTGGADGAHLLLAARPSRDGAPTQRRAA